MGIELKSEVGMRNAEGGKMEVGIKKHGAEGR